MKQAVYLVLALLGACAFLGAAEPADPSNFEMTMATSGDTAFVAGGGSAFSTEVEVDLILNTTIDDVTGWSLGVMADPASDLTLKIVNVSLSEDLTTVNLGGAPGFNSSSAFAASDLAAPIGNCAAGCDAINADAITQAIIVNMMMQDDLDDAETDDFVMLTLTVSIEGTTPAAGDPAATGSIIYTDAIGDPATETLCVHSGNSISPAVKDGLTFTLEGQDCIAATQLTMEIEDASGKTDAQYNTRVLLNFDSDPDNPNDAPIQGWSYGLCIADTTKITIDSAELGADTAVAKDGAEPGFVSLKVGEVFNYEGLTLGVVVDMMSQITVTPQNGFEDLLVTGTVMMTEEGDATYIMPCNEALGDPATPNVMVIGGNSLYMSTFEGTEEDLATASFCNPDVRNEPAKISLITAPPLPVVAAGDMNNDSRLDLADGIYLLNALFRSGPALACEAAGDFNNDGVVDLSDAIGIIYWQLQPVFEDSPAGGYPGPAIGLGCQEVDTALTCEVSTCN